jgi:hypothetical protein
VQITRSTGLELLAATLAAFARRDYWRTHGEPGQRLPLQALAKYVDEYLPALNAAAPAPAAAARPVCRPDQRLSRGEVAFKIGAGWGMSYEASCSDCGAQLGETFLGLDHYRQAAAFYKRPEDLTDLALIEAAAAGSLAHA